MVLRDTHAVQDLLSAVLGHRILLETHIVAGPLGPVRARPSQLESGGRANVKLNAFRQL